MWPPPELGDIVWCRFPERPRDQPGPKPRPVLILTVEEYDDGIWVEAAYGTSQDLNHLHAGEFAIRSNENRAAYLAAGLSYDTKFDLRHVHTLPWNEPFFEVPKLALHGHNPKLGTLHASMLKALESAARAANKI